MSETNLGVCCSIRLIELTEMRYYFGEILMRADNLGPPSHQLFMTLNMS